MKALTTAALIICILFITTEQSLSQTNYGIKAGLNLTKGNFESGTDYALRFHAGFTGQFLLSKKLFLRPELLYSQKGWNIPDHSANQDASITIHYINLPILIGVNLTEKIALFGGPELGYNIKAKRNPPASWTNLYEKFDIGVTLGGNYKLTPKLGLDLRYIYGFEGLLRGDIYDQNGKKIGKFVDGSNRVFQLGLYYIFHKNRN